MFHISHDRESTYISVYLSILLSVYSSLRLSQLYRFQLRECVYTCVCVCVAGFTSLLHQLEKQKVQDGVMKIREEDTLWANSSEVCQTRELTKCVFLLKWLPLQRGRQTERQEVMTSPWRGRVSHRHRESAHTTFSLQPQHRSRLRACLQGCNSFYILASTCIISCVRKSPDRVVFMDFSTIFFQSATSTNSPPSHRDQSGSVKAKACFLRDTLTKSFLTDAVSQSRRKAPSTLLQEHELSGKNGECCCDGPGHRQSFSLLHTQPQMVRLLY